MGGGGAGGTNDGTADAAAYPNNDIGCSLGTGLCSSGAPGGGTVVIRARSVTGTGVIDIRGGNGYNVANDAGGGGGEGGALILQTSDGGSATVEAGGGDGGNAWGAQAGTLSDRHGPGGAGGGGFVAFSPASFSLTANVNGGSLESPSVELTGRIMALPVSSAESLTFWHLTCLEASLQRCAIQVCRSVKPMA